MRSSACCSSLVSIVFDYAKVRAVVEDRRSMIGAIGAGARFARRNAAAVAAFYLLTGCLFVVLLVVYAIAAPGAGSTGAGVWLGIAIGQLYLLGRLWIRLRLLRIGNGALSGPSGARRLHRQRARRPPGATDRRKRVVYRSCQPANTLDQLQFA